MADWSYGDAGDKYPMKRGEVWKVNEALFSVGDLEEGDAPKLLHYCAEDLLVSPTAFYADPPWDKGNARSFRTKAFGKEKSRAVDFLGSLIPRVIEACKLASGNFGIEMGSKHGGDLMKMLHEAGAHDLSITPIYYYRKHPCVIVCGAFGEVGDVIDPKELLGKDDELTPEFFIRQLRNDDVVFDCCGGQGLTSVTADRLGGGSVSMELNPRRAACGIDRVVQASGFEPELVGNFL